MEWTVQIRDGKNWKGWCFYKESLRSHAHHEVAGEGHPPRPGLETMSKMSRKVPGEGGKLKTPDGTLRMVPQAASNQNGAVEEMNGMGVEEGSSGRVNHK